MKDLGRLITAMVTPFKDNGDVDFDRAKEFALELVRTGSDGLLIGGTTGESPSMSEDEKLKLFKSVKDAVKDTANVIAGTTDNNTIASIDLSKKAERLGVDAILLTVPAYNKPTQEGLYRHFKKISESVSIPGILYNVPSRTSLNMDADTTLRLANIDNIVGVKEASSDPDQITNIISEAPEDFKVWSGNDNETFSIMSTGGHGVVSVASNIIGSQVKKMMGYILDGQTELAANEHKRLLLFFTSIFWVTNPIPIRYALNRSGFNIGPPRLPMVEAPEDFKKKFDPVMDSYKMDIS
ncbi:MAG: 4-hydroxy-tetrahydrodipicolinate synthase [Dehalococcoidia bacterium]|jgi:4-hydroxy-tetrahydrodipicolinate synthase|nr:4-hydroxy-tetrahydrodipicolinate synthase [Dehalococcoidia bacterium]